MTQLQQLQPVKLSVSGISTRRAGVETADVTVSNPSRTLAFFIRLQIKQGRDGKDVLPIVWQDNYFSLAPGERKRVTATYKSGDLGQATPFLHVEGWNISADVMPLTSARKQARRG
jgi:exo-1,4-beta-D-glucosaminidase